MEGTRELDLFWEKIRHTVDELVGCLEGLDSDALDWRPFDDANSLDVFATHRMGNLRRNSLNLVCGFSVAHARLDQIQARG